MAAYAEHGFEEENMPTSDEIKTMMVAKAHELFAVCDKEEKGFINKRDMQRLQTELPLSSDQLEAVFDSLDDDGNGFLTLEEFTEGFGSFIGLPPPIEKQESVTSSGGGSERIYENDAIDSAEEEESFNDLVQTIGAHGVFEEVEVLRSLWTRIRRDEPDLIGGFQEFLSKVTRDIKQSHVDLTSLESVMRNKNLTHDEEVRKLYEEMENQLRLEKERIIAEERAKERQLKEDMERELREKERQLQEMLRQQSDLEEKLENVSMSENETKQENERLMREKEEIEKSLDEARTNLDESKSYVYAMRDKHKNEKRERAMAALQISEGIALERESLVKQLDMLRDMNKKLRDDKDEHAMRRTPPSKRPPSPLTNGTPGENGVSDSVDGADEDKENAETESSLRQMSTGSKRNTLTKQGSLMSSYFSSGKSITGNSFDDDIEVDDYDLDYRPILQSQQNSLHSQPGGSSIYENGMMTPDMPRGQPTGGNEITPVHEVEKDFSKMAPERVFKVVFVGDSGVGKSSFIHRFCTDSFKSTFSATIGVDFQVKNLVVEDHLVALQLWDTAGQERFRSITKQYFRKADGVLVMYDVTSESSFTNVRNWMTSVEEGVEENTVLLLCGNKTDLCENDDQRVVKMKDGAALSDEYGALFYETSAKSGYQVVEALTAMASLLREKEDREMQNALSLAEGDANPKKKGGCCS